MFEDFLGWLFLKMIYHPVPTLVSGVVIFIMYMLTIELIDELLKRRKHHSEAAERDENEKTDTAHTIS